MANFFDSPLYQMFNRRPTMNEFLQLSQRYRQFHLSPEEIQQEIKSACDFFNIPMPRLIQDLTNHPSGQTCFINWNRGSYADDVICFNMQQLVDMKVDSKDAFSYVKNNEC